MPEQLTDFGKPGTCRQQRGGDGVPQPVSPDRVDPGASARRMDDLDHRTGRQPVMRRHTAHEQRCRVGSESSAVLDIRGERVADIVRQREPFETGGFASHEKFTVAPVNIAKLDGSDLSEPLTKVENDRLFIKAGMMPTLGNLLTAGATKPESTPCA